MLSFTDGNRKHAVVDMAQYDLLSVCAATKASKSQVHDSRRKYWQSMKRAFIIFSLLSLVCGKSYSILGIDCTSSGKTLVYLICNRDQIQKTFMIETNITQPVNKIMVSASKSKKYFNSR